MTGHIYNYVTMLNELGNKSTMEKANKNTINWMMSYADNTYRDRNTGDMYF